MQQDHKSMRTPILNYLEEAPEAEFQTERTVSDDQICDAPLNQFRGG